jgi:hypothetical protein
MVAGLAVPGAGGAATGGGPLVAAAGDISCSVARTKTERVNPLRCKQRETSDLLVGGGYRAILALGDLMQNLHPDLRDYRRSYLPTWGRFKERTFPAIGNHDYGFRDGKGYFDFFNGVGDPRGRAGIRGRGWYSFDLGRWHLVSLNANCGRPDVSCGPGSPQLEWLRRDLARHPSRCTLAFWHQPRFSSGAHGNDERVSAFWRVLYAAGADVVLNGHDQLYERFAPQTARGEVDRRRGIVQFTVGTGGEALFEFRRIKRASRARQNSTFGILRMRLAGGGFRWAYLAAPGGEALDKGHRRCHGPADRSPG